MQSVNYALPLCGAGNLESVGVMAEELSLGKDGWGTRFGGLRCDQRREGATAAPRRRGGSGGPF